MIVVSKFKNQKRIHEYNESLEALGIDMSEGGEYILESQLDVDNGDKCAMKFFIEKLCERLIDEIPKVRIYGNIVMVDECVAVKALNVFWRNFLIYLDYDSIVRIEKAVGAHLKNTYNSLSMVDKGTLKDYFKGKIGITLQGFMSTQKHISTILDNLGHSKESIIYCCYTQGYYQQCKGFIGGNKVFIGDGVYFAYLSHAKVWLTTTVAPIQDMNIIETKILDLEHNFNASVAAIEWKRKDWHVFHNLYYTRVRYAHYVLAHTKQEWILLNKVCDFYRESLKDKDNYKHIGVILKAGNPSLDFALLEFDKAKEKVEYKDKILLAPSFLSNLVKCDGFVSMIEWLLKENYKIILRVFHYDIDNLDCSNAIRIWKEYDNFEMHCITKWFHKSLLEVGILVTDCSSMGSSFPYVGLVKSLFLNDNPGNIIKLENIELYDPNICSVCSDMVVAKTIIIKELKERKKTEQSIEKYRNEQVYNLGKSGKFIADFIKAL